MIWVPIIYALLVLFARHLAEDSIRRAGLAADTARFAGVAVDGGSYQYVQTERRAWRDEDSHLKTAAALNLIAKVLIVIGVIHTILSVI